MARWGSALAIALSSSKLDDLESSSTRKNNFFNPCVSVDTKPAKFAQSMTDVFYDSLGNFYYASS